MGETGFVKAMQILDLNHVALHVKNVTESAHFYGEVIGLEPKARPAFNFDGAWFALGKVRELHLLEGRDQPVPSHHRAGHFAIEVNSVAEAAEHLQKSGLSIHGPQTRPDGALQVFVTDPDGHWVEFCEVPRSE